MLAGLRYKFSKWLNLSPSIVILLTVIARRVLSPVVSNPGEGRSPGKNHDELITPTDRVSVSFYYVSIIISGSMNFFKVFIVSTILIFNLLSIGTLETINDTDWEL